MCLSLLLALLAECDPAPLQGPVLPRAVAVEIPLISGIDANGVDGGLDTRAADHADVANNSDHDILVAFHTTRTDLANDPGMPAFSEPLKQVEIAIFRYNISTDSWSLFRSELLGSV